MNAFEQRLVVVVGVIVSLVLLPPLSPLIGWWSLPVGVVLGYGVGWACGWYLSSGWDE